MGVHGLWKLIEPAGKPVPLESLENKVLAVDVSIWLYQVTKGLQTTGGGAIPNAHLLGLFNRICKLLYYRIKPVFVFDGGVPLLKKETIEARKRSKRKAQDTSEQLREKLLNNYLKQKAIHDILGSDDGPSTSQVIDDMYALRPLPEDDEDEERIDDPGSSDSDAEVKTAKCESFCNNFQYGKDLHSIDLNDEQFKALPSEIRHELLSEIVETKKQNSWAKIHEMPEDSQDFSKFQLDRLKKRREVQLALDTAAKEMGGRSMTFNEMETMFKEDGIVTDNLNGRRIVGDNVTRFVYVTGKSKEKETEKEAQKLPVKKEKTSVKDQRAKIENIFKNTAPGNSSPIKESIFQDKIQTIEDSIFIKDLSSDDEPEIINDTTESEYIRSLLDKEKLSQDEILKIIKQEQNDDEDTEVIEQEPNENEDFKFVKQEPNDDEDSSPSLIMSDTENKTTNASYPMVISDETVSDEIIQPSQEYQPSKLSILIDQSVKVTSEIVDMEKNENMTVPKENVISKSHSIELFCDDVDEFPYSDDVDDLPQTVMLPKNDNECQDNVPKPKSLELFSDTDSDDFIEVSNEERRSYFKKDDKQIEITFNPGNVIEDDIFSDIFNHEEINETAILDKSQNNPVTSYQQLNDTVILEKSPNKAAISPKTLDDTVIMENGVFPNENLNDTIFEKSQREEFISPLSGEMSKLSTENTSTQNNIEMLENARPIETNEETKAAQPTKTLANILNKVKKAETAVKNAKETKTDSPSKDDPRKRELAKEIQEMLSKEQNELLAERGRQERLGSSITQQMIIEAQELLQLFGLPYIVAPMEAEAQCAFLDKISLTEGTITDDSDIWLFGGQKVYKNFFDNKKFVLQFRDVDIEHFFKLSREQLIQMAMLVGSDYTVGIEGIGPVTAIEILAYFSDSANKPTSTDTIAETLRKFRTWLSSNRTKTSPLSRKCKDVSLTEAFPNTTVIDAYLYPTVNESKEGFTWATPDLDRIRSYMHSKFGWKTSKIDDIILPVMKRLNDKNKQSTLDMYFKQKAFSSIEFGGVSKRVIQAINVMKSKTDERPLQTPSTSKSPRKITPKTPPKRTRRNSKKTPLKRTPTALPVQISSQNSASKKVTAPYFGSEVIPQKEKERLEAAKRKIDAINVYKAQNKNNRAKNAKKKKVLPPKRDSSYLSESSSGDDILP